MFTDNKDFYPTPARLIDRMLAGIDFRMISTVLEPSAGKGDLADAIKRKMESAHQRGYRDEYKADLDCIEIQEDLQSILKGKGHRVVHNDFLTYRGYKKYDLIVSNPPFSCGAKHLLKMLEMQERGGGVVCILNAETLRNAVFNERKVLLTKLEELNASIEYIQEAFMDAERKTDVEIALVKVDIPQEERISFIYEDTLRKAKDLAYKETTEAESYAVAGNDFIKAIVDQYNIEIEAGIKLIDEFNAMAPYILREFKADGTKEDPILYLNFADQRYGGDREEFTYNGFVKRVRAKYWQALFSNPKFTGQLTTKLKYEYIQRVDDLSNYDFSTYNIYSLRAEMSKQISKGVEDTIISLFEELSNKYHWYNETSKNIHYFNGWKTNKSWVINKKVIIPLSGWRDLQYSWGCYDPANSKVIEKLTDIEKCFNYLDGGLTDAVDMVAVLRRAEQTGESKKIQLKYFTVTLYKKGTTHIEFTNEELLKKFNIFGAQRKGWLPPSYGKKGYKEMDAEEQAVVDDFEGEQEYSKVVKNSGYYLFKTEDILMIESREG